MHTQVFSALNEGNKYVQLNKLLPYLMIFFLKHLICGLEKRRTHFDEMLDPRVRTSLYQCFERVGLKNEDFQRKCITYRQVEQVVMDFKSCFPNSFDFSQMETVLSMCRGRMQIDMISRIEENKESYYPSWQDEGRQNQQERSELSQTRR